ncbi:MAG: TatD family hydrolase [Deltaproteobacteria bacterium]|nr:TatD family hydrolase [Deltaproteobacteria bacterium]MBW2533969.1 TatD family hydrolase [Deltaproteobacteria bacterium]
MVSLIDTHCHLAAPELDSSRDEMIARAKDVGVVAAVCVGEHYEDNLRVLELAAREPFVRPALGHHPWFLDRAADDLDRTLALIEQHARELVAIGEVGLDYRVAESSVDRSRQRDLFRELIRAAERHDLPLSVHVRSAGHYVIELLQELGYSRAALHAFDGKAKYATTGAAWGLCFSLPGTLLVSRQKEKLARALPLDRLLLETDTPALSPDPNQPSEPAMLVRIVERAAALRGDDPEALARAAFDNACRLFRLKL